MASGNIAGLGISTDNIWQGSLVSLSLAFSFGLYGLIRKPFQLIQSPDSLLRLYSLFLCACVYHLVGDTGPSLWYRLNHRCLPAFWRHCTVFPLLFTAAVSRLNPYWIGMLQYIAPTISLLIAIFFFLSQFGERRCLWVYLDRAHCLLIRRTEKEK